MKGDFAYNKSYSNGFPLGTVKRLDKYDEGTLSSLYIVFRPKKVNSDFLSIYYDTNKWHREVMKLSAEGARNHGLLNIPVNSFFEKKIIIPILEEEQLKIAKFLKRLEKIITLHQRKINMLETQKKAYTSVIFANKSNNIPNLRFEKFTEAWEQRKLGDVSDVIGGGTPNTNNPAYWDGDIDWYSPAELKKDIYLDNSQRKITELGLKNSSAKILPRGTVLFTSRAGIGNTAILDKESATNQGFQSIVPKDNLLDTYFIYSKSHLLKRYGEINGAGSTFIEVSGKEMSKMPLLLPTIKEQIQIGRLLKSIDNNIVLHQRKLCTLKKLKQVYLNKLFI